MLTKLVEGVHFFQTNVFAAHQEKFHRLAQGQNPTALFITCSDSRINPNLITQTEPGELFICRNAGNLVPAYGAAPHSGEAGSIEYAVSVLGVEHVIVCGHSFCGAMKALLHPETLKELPAVDRWLSLAESTRRVVKENYRHCTSEEELLAAAVQENVLLQLENLRTHPSVAARLARNDLKLHGWVYQMSSGHVHSYDPSLRQFFPLVDEQARRAAAEANGQAGTTANATALHTPASLAAEVTQPATGGAASSRNGLREQLAVPKNSRTWVARAAPPRVDRSL